MVLILPNNIKTPLFFSWLVHIHLSSFARAFSYLSLPDLLITALSHSSAKPFKHRLLSCTSVRLHRGSLAKVKDKEKTKLMRKLTKTNCPEAHFTHRTISLVGSVMKLTKKPFCIRSSNNLGRILFCRYFHFLFRVFQLA